jgi:hypothetical protein
MKIGTFLLVLLLALVSLGFLINDNFYAHSELAEVNKSKVSLEKELGQIKEQMAKQASEIQTLSDQNNLLLTQNNDLQNQKSALELQILSISDQISHLQIENARLQQLATQPELATILPFAPSNKDVTFGLLIPILLSGSGIAVYGIYRHEHKRVHPSIMVRVSQHELDMLIRHRRTNNS